MQGAPATDSDDVAGHAAGHDSDGPWTGSGKRTIRTAGPGHHRRSGGFGGGDGVSGSCRLPGDPYPTRAKARRTTGGPGMRMACFATVMVLLPALAAGAQSPTAVAALPSAPAPNINLSPQAPDSGAPDSRPVTTLTRVQAEQTALKSNPRVTVSHLLALAQHQVVREARSAELPTANGAITAEKALEGSRISAGSLTASRLIPHAGAGGDFSQ